MGSCLLAAFVAFIRTVLLSVLVSCYWGWFLHPLGVPPLRSLWHAYGIGLIIGLFTIHVTKTSSDTMPHLDEDARAKMGKAMPYFYMLVYAGLLLCGYVAHRMMPV